MTMHSASSGRLRNHMQFQTTVRPDPRAVLSRVGVSRGQRPLVGPITNNLQSLGCVTTENCRKSTCGENQRPGAAAGLVERYENHRKTI